MILLRLVKISTMNLFLLRPSFKLWYCSNLFISEYHSVFVSQLVSIKQKQGYLYISPMIVLWKLNFQFCIMFCAEWPLMVDTGTLETGKVAGITWRSSSSAQGRSRTPTLSRVLKWEKVILNQTFLLLDCNRASLFLTHALAILS